MRRRLTASILLLVAATLALAAIAGIYVARRDALSSARHQLVTQAEVIVAHPETLALRHRPAGAARHPVCCVALLRTVGGYTSLRIARLDQDASGGPSLSDLPAGLSPPASAPEKLARGDTVSGDQGSLVYTLLPITLGPAEVAHLRPPLASGQSTVLAATRQVTLPASGLGPFLVIAAVVLVLATGVAFWLASRFSRPLAQTVGVTRRIAGGQLEARVGSAPGGMPELDELGSSVNAMAEELERTRAQQQRFLLSVSHDLRTPLTSIRGYAEAIMDGATTDPAAAAGVVREEAGRLERLVQDLLDLARLDARTFSLHLVALDLGPAVHAAASAAAPDALRRGVQITVHEDGAGVRVLADPDRLGQLLANLVENAVRFARGSVLIGYASTEGIPALWVTDDGPGIPREDLDRVFQPYFSITGPTSEGSPDAGGPSEAAGGRGPWPRTGLGLAIVRELAVAMGGDARVTSPAGPDGGTTFAVTLRPARHGD